ncbi:MAG TPA: alpha/beta hydrolase [Gemmataceae bacterium]|jgi:pimeloyl-ACP methyl ester carboxylesterase
MSVAEAAARGHLESTWAVVNGLRMHARVGDRLAPAGAKAVVLVHGVGVSSRYMVPLAEQLAPDYRVFAPDLPGFGRSDKSPRLLDVRGLADTLAAWLRVVGLDRPALFGNSLGCQVIIDLAGRHPELVERAVLLGPTTDPRVGNVIRLIGRGVLDLPHESPALYPVLVADYLRAGPVRTVRTLQAGVDDPLTVKLPRVRAPVLVVRGDRDPIAPRRWVREMAERLPAGRWTEVTGAAHAAHFSAPDRVAELIRPFLDGDEN